MSKYNLTEILDEIKSESDFELGTPAIFDDVRGEVVSNPKSQRAWTPKGRTMVDKGVKGIIVYSSNTFIVPDWGKTKKYTENIGESFDSLAKKLDKQKGIDKEEAGKIAGSIAAKKMAGAGKGPTAKQKARVNEEEVSDTEQVFDIIYAAGGKDVAPDFLDAIGEEFEIPFEFGRVDEQKESVNEDREVFNRIDGMVNQNFKFNMLDEFIKLYADLTEEDPYDSEDVLMYLHDEMANFLKEKGMYEDGFNPDDMKEVLDSKSDDGTEDNVDNIDKVASPSTKGVGYNQVSKSNTDEDDMESKEIANPKPMYEDLKNHFKRFI